MDGAPSAAPRTARPEPRLLKVLPHFLDLEGRHTVNPSLFDRDAYQAELRLHPERRSGMRFDILWKPPRGGPYAFDLSLELRGSLAPAAAPVILSARATSRARFTQWTRVPLVGPDYAALGDLLAWRIRLLRDHESVAEMTSFLW